MQQRTTGLNGEATSTTQDRTDAETARPTLENHGGVTYQVAQTDDGLTSYKPVDRPAPAEPTIPPGVEEQARQAGQSAAARVRYTYEATIKAMEAQRDSDAPAYWLKSYPCPDWCTDADMHRSGDDPEEREHASDVHALLLETMPPSVSFAEFRAPELTLMLLQKYREAEARILIEDSGDVAHWYATLDEAESLANTLLALVAQARGGTSST